MTGLDWKSDAPPTVIRRFHEGTGKAPNGTGGVKFSQECQLPVLAQSLGVGHNELIMTTVTPPSEAPVGRILPTGPRADEVLAEIWKSRGWNPPTEAELAALPPWTDDEAAAFTRFIDEMFEQVDDVPT